MLQWIKNKFKKPELHVRLPDVEMQAHPIAVNPTQDVASHAHASRLANLYRAQADGDCRVAEIEDEINRHQHLIAAAGHAAPNNLNEAEALVSKLGA